MPAKKDNSIPESKTANEKPQIQLQLQTATKSDRSAKICPVDGSRGKPVPGQTIKALLKVSLRLVREEPYFFCPAPNCPVVYFSNSVCASYG